MATPHCSSQRNSLPSPIQATRLSLYQTTHALLRLLVMSLFMVILRHTVRRAASTEPVFHTSLTIWPFITGKTYPVTLFVTVVVTVKWIISRDTPPSAATSIPMSPANLSSLIITRVVSARVIPRDALHAATWSIVVLGAIQFQLKFYGGAAARKRYKLLATTRSYPWFNGFFNIIHQVIVSNFVLVPNFQIEINSSLRSKYKSKCLNEGLILLSIFLD